MAGGNCCFCIQITGDSYLSTPLILGLGPVDISVEDLHPFWKKSYKDDHFFGKILEKKLLQLFLRLRRA